MKYFSSLSSPRGDDKDGRNGKASRKPSALTREGLRDELQQFASGLLQNQVLALGDRLEAKLEELLSNRSGKSLQQQVLEKRRPRVNDTFEVTHIASTDASVAGSSSEYVSMGMVPQLSLPAGGYNIRATKNSLEGSTGMAEKMSLRQTQMGTPAHTGVGGLRLFPRRRSYISGELDIEKKGFQAAMELKEKRKSIRRVSHMSNQCIHESENSHEGYVALHAESRDRHEESGSAKGSNHSDECDNFYSGSEEDEPMAELPYPTSLKRTAAPFELMSDDEDEDEVLSDEYGSRVGSRGERYKKTLTNGALGVTRRMSMMFVADPFKIDLRATKESTPLEKFVSSECFSNFSALAICLSSALIGVQTDYNARHWLDSEPWQFRMLERMFCIVFSVELVLRIGASGFARFISGPTASGNIFDMTLVIMMFCDEVLQDFCHFFMPSRGTTSDHVSKIVRMIRILRVVRIFRLARILHQFGELRMLVVCITDALHSLFWIVLLLLFMIYILACVLTQIVTTNKVRYLSLEEEAEMQAFTDLQKYYGTLDVSMFTIYETITEGTHWSHIMEPLVEYCSPWLKVVFFLYSAFVFFALLNVVTGAFVESAIRTGTEDRKKLLMYQMKQLFEQADTDGSGTISWEEFHAQLDNPQMIEYLKGIDLDPDEALELFQLIDIEDCGEIEPDDLVCACLRLHGPAKSIDLATFMREYERQCKYWSSHAGLLEQTLAVILEMLEQQSDNRDTMASAKTEALGAELGGLGSSRRDVGFTY